MPFDADANAYVYIDGPHKKVHSGWSFTYPYDSSIPADGSIAMLIVPADGEEIHFTGSVSLGDGAGRARLWRNPTVTSNGSEVVWVNRKDDSSNVLATEVYLAPSYSTGGAVLCEGAYLGSGQGPRRIGGATNTRDEWVMEYPNEYIIEVFDLSGATNNCVLSPNVYRAGII